MSNGKGQVIRVAVDAMGGDHAPVEIVKGALMAASEGLVHIILVGEYEVLTDILRDQGSDGLEVEVVPAEGMIQEGESPNEALRRKPRASIMIAAQLVKNGRADALVSMGATGATLASAYFTLGLLEGVERPVLGGPFIGLAPRTVFVDLGTNVDCRPGQLVSFGVIGSVLCSSYLGISSPRVGLLSVGTEPGKGNRQVKEAYHLFQESGLNFVGLLEGNDLLTGNADVVVCDGFVGNVLMKFAEGLGSAISSYLRENLGAQGVSGDAENVFAEIHRVTNLVEHFGGGPLLGVDGVVIIGHGRSRAASVKSAIEMARDIVDSGFVGQLGDRLRQVRTESGL